MVLRKSGLATEGLRSKSISEIQGQFLDYVIILCGKTHNDGAKFPNVGEVITWDSADPKSIEGLAPFEIALRDLDARIKTFAVMQTSASNSA